MAVFERNMQKLAASRPGLARDLSSVAIPSGWTWKSAKKQGEVLFHHEEALNSLYDPVKEAERLAGSLVFDEGTVCVCLGVGTGHLIEALLDRTDRLIIIEPQIWRLRLFFSRSVREELLDPARAAWVAADDPLRLNMACWTLLDGERDRRLAFVNVPHSDQDRLEPVRRQIIQTHETILRDTLAQQVQSRQWFGNILANIPCVAESADLSELENLFKGVPVFLCAAGPSLSKNAAQLKRVQDRALIAAVDTAAGTLFRLGVTPHLIITVDTNRANLRDFEGIPEDWLSAVHAVCDRVVYPEIPRKNFAGRFFGRTVNAVVDLEGRVSWRWTALDALTDRLVGPMGVWQSGGSVAANAFDLARVMGCSPLILVGQDLAYSGGRLHSSGVGYEGEWLRSMGRFTSLETKIHAEKKKKDAPVFVKAYDGTELRSNPVLVNNLHWFERTIAYGNMQNVYNATEGGAAVTGAEPIVLSEAVERFCSSDIKKDIRERLCRAAARRRGKNAVRERLTAARENYRRAQEEDLSLPEVLSLSRAALFSASALRTQEVHKEAARFFEERTTLILNELET